MYLRDFFALKPFHDYSLCSVCILPQPVFYSRSAVCILPLVRSLQSAVRSLRFTLTGCRVEVLCISPFQLCLKHGLQLPICNSLLLGVIGRNRRIQYESLPLAPSIKSHSQDHSSDFLSEHHCFWLAKMGGEM